MKKDEVKKDVKQSGEKTAVAVDTGEKSRETKTGAGVDSSQFVPLPPSIADVRAGRLNPEPNTFGVAKEDLGPEVVVGVDLAAEGAFKQVVEVRSQLYRRKPLLCEAAQQGDGGWIVKEAGREVRVGKEEFEMLYELALDPNETVVDAGMPDLETGTVIEKDGRRMQRVMVMSGKGTVAYWYECKNSGQSAGFRVTADMIDNSQAAHRVGKLVEPYEGKPGGKTWVVLS